MKTMPLRSSLLMLFVLCLPLVATAQTRRETLNRFLNERLQSIVRARIDLRERTRQTETPNISQNTTSLVDQSSASALIGVALNLSGLTAKSNDTEDADSVSVTATAYSLLAAARGVNPLNPGFYNRNAAWRNFSATLGYDDEKDESGEMTERAKIIGFKYLIVNQREPGKHPRDLETIRNNLVGAAGAFGRLYDQVLYFMISQESVRNTLLIPEFREYLQEQRRSSSPEIPATEIEIGLTKLTTREQDLFPVNTDYSIDDSLWTPAERAYFVTFQNRYLVTRFPQLLQVLGAEGLDRIEDFIEESIEPFLELQTVSNEALERIRRAPQFSFAFLTKQRPQGGDDYMGELIFDYGVANRINLTANGAFEYKDNKAVGADLRGARFAAQLQFQLTKEDRLAGRRPFNFFLAADGKWMSGMEWMYRAQTKIVIPIADGIDFPISLTFANRTELIEEEDVRGQFGFTFDLARLVKAFSTR
jgi:hypothetical protein